jgi:hypothetical protein
MDPVENVYRWSRWAVSGAPGTISQVLSVLDANPPAGWKRLSEDDLLPLGGLVRPAR